MLTAEHEQLLDDAGDGDVLELQTFGIHILHELSHVLAELISIETDTMMTRALNEQPSSLITIVAHDGFEQVRQVLLVVAVELRHDARVHQDHLHCLILIVEGESAQEIESA